VYGGRRRAATKSKYVANFLARSGIGVGAGRPPNWLLARSCNASTKSVAPSARERQRVRVRAMLVSTADADRTVSWWTKLTSRGRRIDSRHGSIRSLVSARIQPIGLARMCGWMSAWIELTVKYHHLPDLTFVMVAWPSQKVGTCVNEISAHVLKVLGASCVFTPSQAPLKFCCPMLSASRFCRPRACNSCHLTGSASWSTASSHGYLYQTPERHATNPRLCYKETSNGSPASQDTR
jgi:hypothetical protein